jgi:hypothetical protein
MYTVTMDIDGLTLDEYKAVATALGPEARSAAGILLHIATQTDSGYRIVEIGTLKTASRRLWRNTSDPLWDSWVSTSSRRSA